MYGTPQPRMPCPSYTVSSCFWRSIAMEMARDRKSTRLNSSHLGISYAVFCLKKKNVRAVRLVHARLRNEVAGQVLNDELIVRQIGVEGADGVVAVTPGMVEAVVELETARHRV